MEKPADPLPKPKIPRLKLDQAALLSERGFKFLRNKGAELKFDDGASEETNLDSLMMFYREWAHYLHPNLKFTDFVVKVKKECSSKTMREYMAALRREATHSTIDEAMFNVEQESKEALDLAFEKDDTPDNPELLFEEEHVEEKYTDDEDALREWDEMNGM